MPSVRVSSKCKAARVTAMAVTSVKGLHLPVSAVYSMGHVRVADQPESCRALSTVVAVCQKASTALSLSSEAIFEKMADISKCKERRNQQRSKG